jgi:hypothetical protein
MLALGIQGPVPGYLTFFALCFAALYREIFEVRTLYRRNRDG